MPSPLQALSAKDRSTGASSISASDRRLVVTFYAASAVTAKDAVCFATGKNGADRVEASSTSLAITRPRLHRLLRTPVATLAMFGL